MRCGAGERSGLSRVPDNKFSELDLQESCSSTLHTVLCVDNKRPSYERAACGLLPAKFVHRISPKLPQYVTKPEEKRVYMCSESKTHKNIINSIAYTYRY